MSNRIQLSDEQIDQLLNLVEKLDPDAFDGMRVFAEMTDKTPREMAQNAWKLFFDKAGVSYDSIKAAIIEYYQPEKPITPTDVMMIVHYWNSHAIYNAQQAVSGAEMRDE